MSFRSIIAGLISCLITAAADSIAAFRRRRRLSLPAPPPAVRRPCRPASEASRAALLDSWS